MSPTPVTFSSPTAPAGYAWEATDEEVAERYGVPIADVARFDLNTSPAPPPPAARILATGALDRPMSEYPAADYRRLVRAAAGVYGVESEEILVGAGADEVLDLIAKAFLPADGTGRAVVPVPTYAMYRVLTEQRGARVVAVPRLGPAGGYALDPDAIAAAAADAAIVWLCNPNNPTGLPEAPGTVEALVDRLAAEAAAAERAAPVVVIDEAYAEFTGTSLLGLRDRYARLIVVRTASKAYALAGLRVGFGLARPVLIAAIAPYRPPGSVSVVSASIVADLLPDLETMAANVERIGTERVRLAAELTGCGWDVGPSVTNFLLVAFGSPDRSAAVADALLRRGLVPRTFGSGHPLADHLRLTVRSPAENDRMIEAARAIGPIDAGSTGEATR